MSPIRALFTVSAALLILAAPAPLKAQSSLESVEPGKRREIARLLELTGMDKLMEQMMDQMFAQMSQEDQGSRDFLAKFRAKVDTSEFINSLIPIHAKHFSEEDLQAMNDFYATEAGKRMLAKMPVVMNDAMQVGQAWGQKLSQQVLTELEKDRAAKKGSDR